jgi:hypothetical protein
LGRIYNRAIELFLRGDYEGALDGFKSIYEVDCAFRDVAKILDDYYAQQTEWTAKYRDVFRTSIVGRHAARFRRLRVTLRLVVRKMRLWTRGLTASRSRRRPDGSGLGLFTLGKPVQVGPAPTHHLVAAKEFPPSDKTRNYPRD